VLLALSAAFPPLVINIEKQLSTEPPLRDLLEQVDQARAVPGVLAAGLLFGFPYADVPELGASVVVTTNGDPALAQRLSEELARQVWAARASLQGDFLPLAAAVEQAARLPGPVGLLDMGDNVGGGSPGDGTHLVQALWRQDLGPTLACLCDPAVVRTAEAAGLGARLQMAVGAKTSALDGVPLAASFEVAGFHPGRFEEPGVRHGGFRSFDQGPSVVLRASENLTLLVTSERVPPFSLRQLTSCGLAPERFRFVVLKGVHAPLAAYGSVCRSFLRADTPGSTTADPRRLEYRRRRQPLYPFETEVEWLG
jgi:microcystin degradation protein MlrC